MKIIKKCIISWVVILSMLLIILPVPAFAIDDNTAILTENLTIMNEEVSEQLIFTNEILQNNSSAITDYESIDTQIENINNDSLSSTDVQLLGDTSFSGTCGPNLTWILDDEGTLTISGIGEMEDYTAQGYVPWYHNGYVIIGKIKKVVIESGVTSIGDLAFLGCYNLKYVELPETVTDIGISAFDGCSSLQEITLPSNLTVISAYAFNKCEVLKELIVPQNVSVIGLGAFNGCSSLEKIILPASVIEIGKYPDPSGTLRFKGIFSGCILLKSAGPIGSNSNIEFGWTNEFPDRAFYGSELTQITIPNTIQKIGANAFENCDNIEQVIIPEGIIEIGSGAFSNCDNLKYIQIPNSVEKVSYAFNSNQLKTVGPIGSGCNIEIGWSKKVPDYAFSRCNNISSIIIPEGVTSIGNGAFSDCSTLEYVRIPASVVYIGDRSSVYTGVFSDCDKLTSAGPIGSNSNIEYGWKIEIPEDAFSNCDSLISVDILDGIISIGNSAFSGCNSLANVNIPESVNTIENSAFSDCNKLNNVTISGGVTNMGDSVFRNCNNLSSISIKNGVSTIGSDMFYGCSSLTKVDIPNSVTSIGRSAFFGCSSLNSVTIPESVNTIEWYTFNNCTNLSSVAIPKSVIRINGNAFSGCDNLTDIYYSGSEADWNTIDIDSYYNEDLTDATIHYNSTGPDNPGTEETNSAYIIDVFTEYNAETKQAVFGINPDVYTYKVTDETDMSFVDQLDELLGQRVLVHYISGEYGESDQLVRYILSITPANVKTGTVESITESTITIDGQTYNQNLNGFIGLDSYIGQNVVCYFNNDIVVDMKLLEKKTGILSAGSNNTVTIDDIQYIAIFDGIPPYLSAPDLWFGHNVNYWISSDIVYQIELPDYQTNYKKKLIGYDSNTQIATFHDGSIFYVSSNIKDNISSLINHWVTITVTTSATGGGELTEISLIKPELGLKIEMVNPNDIYLKNDKYSYDGTTYENSSAFEIKFEITVSNSISGVTESDLEQMKDDSSLDITLDELKAIAPDGFNFGWTGSGNIEDFSSKVIHAGEIYTVTGFVRPDMLFFVDTEDVIKSIECSANTTNGDSKIASTYFKIINLDYEEPPTEGDNNEEEDIEFTSWEKGLLSEFYKAKDIDVTMQSGEYSLSNYFEDDVVKDICKTVSVWAGILKTDLANQTKGTLPTCLKIQVPMNKDNDKHQATIIFKYNNLYSSSYASLNYISYALKDNETGRTLISESLFSSSSSASFRNFADGVNAYLKVKYGEEAKDFCKKISKYLIKDFADITGKQYINTMLEVLTQFDELKGYIDETKDILESSIVTESMTLSEFNEIAAKHVTIECPVDVFVYDEQNNLCGKIENDVVTFSTNDVFLYVENSMKSVWMNDDYHFELISTDSGYMDYSIEEYSAGKKNREITFNKVPLYLGLSYSAECPQEMNTSSENYILISNTGSKIYPTDDTNENVNIGNGNSGGGSVTPTSYSISISDTDGGTITISPKTASKDKIVTITAVPDEGYKLDTLSVSDKNGNQIEFTKKTDTEYTFKMPASKVTVNATFSKVIAALKPSSMLLTDVSENAWYYNAVKYVYENGMMQGISDTEFAPTEAMNRAMIVTVLHRLENTPETTSTNQFADVESNQWYTDSVQWAFENDIVNGYSSDRFVPMDNVTREQLAVILYNYTNYKGGNTDIAGDLTAFQDADNTSNWAKNAISWAIGSGLLSGKGNGILDPKGTATRAEVAQILMNYCIKVI